MCQERGWTILNGRAKGDEEGRLTYVGPKASSTIDYIIVKEDEGTNPINRLEVVPRTESDHLPIMVQWTEGESRDDRMEEEGETERETQYIWKENKIQEFQGNLVQMWKVEWNGLNPGEKMGKLNEIIKEAARKAGMIRTRKTKPRQAWFDKECKDKRKEVWKDLKAYLKSKKEEDRLKVVGKRKELKKLYLRKKMQKQEEKWEEIESSRTITEFWKNIGKFRQGKRARGAKIEKEDWLRHFCQLLA